MVFSKFSSYYIFPVFQSGLQSVQKAICLNINHGLCWKQFVTRLKTSTVLETICHATEGFHCAGSNLSRDRRLPLCWKQFVTRPKASTVLETICHATEGFHDFKSNLSRD